jgi:hypothetical protein
MSTYSPIATQTLSANAASVAFNGVPQGYTDLVVIIKGQGTSNIAITTTFNNDTATNYSRAYFYADGSGQASGRVQNESGVIFSFNAARGHTIMHINGYSNSVGFKNALISNDYYDNGVVRTSGVWRKTAPITSINFSGSNIASGTVISLYGLAGGQAGAKASGGVITTSGAYTIHTFLQTGGFTPNEALSVDYLVVAGGGGGGGGGGADGEGAGGGAGGLRSTVTATGGGGTLETALSLPAGITYPVTVGAGGAGNVSSSFPGSNGTNSTFASVSSVGGGGGGSRNTEGYIGQIGGSGGGGGQRDNTLPNYGEGIASQGYRGGNGMNNGSPRSDTGGGGGGGASSVGSDAPTGATGGAGGSSLNVSISGSSVAYAGGGGGAGSSTGGASGGAGAGAGNTSTAATANSGSGGGGNGYNNPVGGAGGSGIVIVRYLT